MKRLRLLFLLPFAPRFDAAHGGRASIRVIDQLARRHDVALLYLRASGEGPAADELAARCDLVEEVRLTRMQATRRRLGLAASLVRGRPMEAFLSASDEYARRVRELASAWRPDVVEAELERMAQYLPRLAGLAQARVLVAYEADAASAADAFGAARGAQKLFRFLDFQAWRRYEPWALRAADAVVTFSDRDRAILSERAPSVRTVTIPLQCEIPDHTASSVGTDPPTAVFVGGFGHVPNVDAAIRLATEIFPTVVERCPNARLEIVGTGPPPAVARLANNRVTITGRVETVEPYLERAAVVVAPLRLGGGVRVKVLEALAAGKAVVATHRAVEGIPIVAGRDALVADSDADFADALVRLLADPGERRRLAAAARQWAERNLDPARSAAAYEELYVSLLTSAGAHEPGADGARPSAAEHGRP